MSVNYRYLALGHRYDFPCRSRFVAVIRRSQNSWSRFSQTITWRWIHFISRKGSYRLNQPRLMTYKALFSLICMICSSNYFSWECYIGKYQNHFIANSCIIIMFCYHSIWIYLSETLHTNTHTHMSYNHISISKHLLHDNSYLSSIRQSHVWKWDKSHFNFIRMLITEWIYHNYLLSWIIPFCEFIFGIRSSTV